MNKIIFPVGYFPNPIKSEALELGSFYIGLPDIDPTVSDPSELANQKTVTALQEDQTEVAISQPIELSVGGVPMYDGEYPSLFVDGDYSMQVLDSLGAQVYFIPSAKVVTYSASLEIDDTDSPADALSVEGIGILYCDTSGGNITIGGFTGGVANQTVRIIKFGSANDLIIENDESVVGSQDIFLDKGADKTFSTLGGVTVTYKDGVGWFESEAIASAAIVSGDIGLEEVKTANIKDLNVTAAKIANTTITATQLATDAVETLKINDGAVTYAKLDASNKQRVAVAWGAFNGVLGVVELDYFNISGIVRDDLGRYTVSFTAAMDSADYVITACYGQIAGVPDLSNLPGALQINTRTSGGFGIATYAQPTTVSQWVDSAYISFAVYGTLA